MFGKSYYRQTLANQGPSGSRSRAAGYDTRPAAINPLLAETWTAVVGGTAADGTYSYKIIDEDKNETVISFVRAAAENNNAIAAALAAKHNATSPADDYFDATVNTATVTLAGKVPGKVFTIETVSVPGGATLTISKTVTAGGTDIAPGRFVARKAAADPSAGTSDEIRNLTGADEIGDIWGVVEQISIPREIDAEADSLDRNIKPGDTASVITTGYLWMEAETAMAVTDTVFARITAGAGEVAGTVRSDADGGDAIDVSTIAKIITPCAAGERCELSINVSP